MLILSGGTKNRQNRALLGLAISDGPGWPVVYARRNRLSNQPLKQPADCRPAKHQPGRIGFPAQRDEHRRQQDQPGGPGDQHSASQFEQTEAISASELMFTASRNALVQGERRRRGTTGLSNAVKTNDGKKTAAVASAAPGTPRKR